MKLWFAFTLTAAFLFSQAVVSQSIVVEPAVNEALVLRLGEYKGTLQWQVSPDGEEWSDVPNATADTLNVSASNNLYYRGSIRVPGCPEYYTATVHIQPPIAESRTYMQHPHLQWVPDANADRYDVQISRNSTFTDLADTDTVAVPRYVPLEPLVEGEYWWRVRAYYGSSTGSWSIVRKITVNSMQRIYTINTTDNLSTIQTTIANAVNNRPSKLTFATGTYTLYLANNTNLIELEDVKDLIIDGRGSTILMTNSNSGFAKLINCENIQFTNFEIDWVDTTGRPASHSAGQVTSINTGNASFVV